ncbi:DUF2057 domain-containing protein [Thalassotalea psychrophila]|uniref:DUF2057 domain-containing protein n=1 Tax=Thalassotalea psychrophila TaxID=3065647 RepID=A0ABY9TQ17_9GAMM|nr:DUF2057 domain-containing protein [Colwelliaceae bacterium SQ149]
MKFLFLPLCFLITSFSALAAKLVVPEEFIVVRLNGEQYSTSFFSSTTELFLGTGQNVLVLKYSELFDDDTEDHHITVKSKPFILLFSVGKEDKLKFSFPKQNDVESAKNYAKSPIVSLIKPNGSAVPIIAQSLTTYNDTVMKETLSRRQEIVKRSLNENDKGQFTQTGPQNLLMLKYWWQQASEQERKEFLSFIKDNQEVFKK